MVVGISVGRSGKLLKLLALILKADQQRMIWHKCAKVRYSSMNYIDKQRTKLTRNILLDYILEGEQVFSSMSTPTRLPVCTWKVPNEWASTNWNRIHSQRNAALSNRATHGSSKKKAITRPHPIIHHCKCVIKNKAVSWSQANFFSWDWGCSSMKEHLLHMHKALGSIPYNGLIRLFHFLVCVGDWIQASHMLGKRALCVWLCV